MRIIAIALLSLFLVSLIAGCTQQPAPAAITQQEEAQNIPAVSEGNSASDAEEQPAEPAVVQGTGIVEEEEVDIGEMY